VLEDAGRLLDEAAALLRAGREHRVELALADDDVHLAADAESDSSSCTSSSRQGCPLIAYSEPPLRNMVREIVTSA
jgi:hypothetical protein